MQNDGLTLDYEPYLRTALGCELGLDVKLQNLSKAVELQATNLAVRGAEKIVPLNEVAATMIKFAQFS